MRSKRLNFEQLVDQNIKEILDDENSINQLEMRLEKRHELSTKKHGDQHTELFSKEG